MARNKLNGRVLGRARRTRFNSVNEPQTAHQSGQTSTKWNTGLNRRELVRPIRFVWSTRNIPAQWTPVQFLRCQMWIMPLAALWLTACCTSPILHKAGPEYLVCETEFVSFEIVRARE